MKQSCVFVACLLFASLCNVNGGALPLQQLGLPTDALNNLPVVGQLLNGLSLPSLAIANPVSGLTNALPLSNLNLGYSPVSSLLSPVSSVASGLLG